MNTFPDLFGSSSGGQHLSDWSGGNWIATICWIAFAGLLGAVAVGMARTAYWIYAEHDRKWEAPIVLPAMFIGALVISALSMWPLTNALPSLARHSRSVAFAGTTTMLSTLVVVIGFAVAARVGDLLAKWYLGLVYLPERPKYLWLIPAVPAITVFCIAFWTHINERVYREGAASVILELLLSSALVIGAFCGLIKLLSALDRYSERS